MQGYYNYYPYSRYSRANDQNNTMTLYGKGSLKVKPDIATADIGVEIENKDLKIAQAENSVKANRVLNTLIKMGIKERDIQTQSYNITPEYDYIEGKQVFRNYKVSNIFNVVFRDLNKIGETIDAAVASGANVVNNITFTIASPEKYYNIALKEAVKNALEKGKEIGETLNVIVNNIPINVVEERQEFRPINSKVYMAAPSQSTPIMEGQLEISADVKVTLNYIAKKF